MTSKKLKLVLIENENKRTMSLKNRKIGLVKKVKELTILCDVKGCLIIFSPKEVEPMVWPSVEAARGLVDNFFALPDIVRMKKETKLESYVKEKIRKVDEQLKNYKKKSVDDQLMVQLHRGRRLIDLNLSEIYDLISFSKNEIMLCRKRLGFVQHPPLREPPVHLLEAQSEELRTTENKVFVGDRLDDERARRADEAISIDTIRGNQSPYLIDQWIFASPEPPQPKIHHQQIGMEMEYYNENPNSRSHLLYQGSNSTGNQNMEVGPQVTNFHGLVGSVSQPLQYHNMDNNSIMDMNQPRQYHFGLMSHEIGVQEGGRNINNGDPQFHRSNNITATNDGLRQEPPPIGTSVEEGNADAWFGINWGKSGINNHHF